MCVLTLIYSFEAACRLCAARCVITIWCYLLFSNYSSYVSLIFFVCLFSCYAYVFLFCEFCVFVLYCVLCVCLYVTVSFLFLYMSTDHCHRVETQLQ